MPSVDSADNSELDEMLGAVSMRVSQIDTILLESRSVADLRQKNLSNLVVIGAKPRRSTEVYGSIDNVASLYSCCSRYLRWVWFPSRCAPLRLLLC
jgi:hypothetical protein